MLLEMFDSRHVRGVWVLANALYRDEYVEYSGVAVGDGAACEEGVFGVVRGGIDRGWDHDQLLVSVAAPPSHLISN